jgi:ribosomal subunit interface protein
MVQMQHVTVSGRHMELGESLIELVQTQMAILSQKYFGTIVTSRVVFAKRSKGRNFACNIQVQVGRKMHYASNAEFDNVIQCFTQASERMAKQLRRKKRCLHEDKPIGRKDSAFRESLKPVVLNGATMIHGNDLSTVDVRADEPSARIEAMYR